jgi:adenosylhomocysteine nucleosidase
VARPGLTEAEGTTAIVAAMDAEVAPLRARLSRPATFRASGVEITVGRLRGVPLAIAVTGDGAGNAERGVAVLFAALPVARVIVVGVAGGVTADLGVAELVVGERIVDERDGSVRRADDALAEIVARSSGARCGVVVTAKRIADTVEEKRRLRGLATAAIGGNADERAMVVDLESAIFVGACARARIPVVALRAISDTATEPVPPILNRSRDAGGAVRRGRVALGLVADPRALRPLLVLRDRVAVCAAALGHAVERTAAALAARAPSPMAGAGVVVPTNASAQSGEA